MTENSFNNVTVNFTGEKVELTPGIPYYVVKRADGPNRTYPFEVSIGRQRSYEEARARAEELAKTTGHSFCVVEFRVITVSRPSYNVQTLNYGEPY